MSINKISLKDVDRDRWLELRKQGIGGSDAASIIGLNPYSSAFQIYLDKLGLVPPTEDNEAMRQGRDLEEYVASRFEEASGLKVRRCNSILLNDEYPFALANVDRLVVGEKAGLECKTTSVFNRHDFESGDYNDNYYVQCQHYMAVTGYEVWYLAVLVLNRGFYWWKIKRNEEDIKSLMAAEKEFWEDNVLAKKEPAPDGSKRAGEVINSLHPQGDDDLTIELFGKNYKQIFDRYDEINGIISHLEAEKESIKQSIQLEMGEATKAFAAGKQIIWKNIATNRLDSKKLKAEKPEIYAQYVKQSKSRRFEIKEA